MDFKIQADGKEFPHQEIRMLDGIGLGDIVQIVELDSDRLGVTLVPTDLHNSQTLERFILRPGESAGSLLFDLLPSTGEIPPIIFIDDPAIADTSDELEFTESVESGDTVGLKRVGSNTLGVYKIRPDENPEEKCYTVEFGRTPYIIVIKEQRKRRWWQFWK